jgi:opacity protein-like surface antigen
MYRSFLLFFLVVSLTVLVAAQDEDKRVEVFAGYSYMTIDDHKSNNPIDHVGNLDGFNVAVTGFVSKRLGITADFSAGFNSGTQAVTGGSLRYKSRNYSFYVGPHYRFSNTTRVTPFVHALVGVSVNRFSYLLTPNSTTAATSSVSQSAPDFAMALGGGLDVRVHKRVSIRLFQIDYNPVFASNRPQFGTNTNVRFDNIRFSSGIVF